MSSSNRATVVRVVEDHGAKFLRYCGVSVINVITGVGTLLVCLELLDMQRVVANVTAWVVSTIPAYLLSRYWVWQQRGTNSVKSEVGPFWFIALVGLGFSSFCIWRAGDLTDNSYVLSGVTFCAYGVVWVAKYLVLDRLMWGPKDMVEVV